MRVMSKESPKAVSEIMRLAIEYFNGLFDLKISEHIPNCCAEFRNDFGYVTIQVFPHNNMNEVILTSQEWEYQILDFLNVL